MQRIVKINPLTSYTYRFKRIKYYPMLWNGGEITFLNHVTRVLAHGKRRKRYFYRMLYCRCTNSSNGRISDVFSASNVRQYVRLFSNSTTNEMLEYIIGTLFLNFKFELFCCDREKGGRPMRFKKITVTDGSLNKSAVKMSILTMWRCWKCLRYGQRKEKLRCRSAKQRVYAFFVFFYNIFKFFAKYRTTYTRFFT